MEKSPLVIEVPTGSAAPSKTTDRIVIWLAPQGARRFDGDRTGSADNRSVLATRAAPAILFGNKRVT